MNSFENERRQRPILDDLVQFDEPLVKLILLLLIKVVRGQVLDQLLERAHHVPEEAHAHHFDYDLVPVLNYCMSVNVTVANRGESRDDPVYTCDINAREVLVLYATGIIRKYPPLILLKQIVAN